jgi:ATP-dependent DNA helicase RecG
MKEIDGGFLVTIFKDVYSEDQLRKLGLNERQLKALLHIKEAGSISNQKYQILNSVSKATATRDLTELVDDFQILKREGTTGAGTSYVIKGS